VVQLTVLMFVDLAGNQKPAPRSSPTKPVSHGPPSGVVVKTLAEIKREKVRRMQQHPTAADETRTKTSEPVQRIQREPKIKLYTPQGTDDLHILAHFITITAAFMFFCVTE